MVELVGRIGRLFGVTHCYTGYPMVREARAAVRRGSIGAVRLVEAEFCAGDPGVAREPADPNARHWRFREDMAGKEGLLGEVGSHAFNLVSYVTGLRPVTVSARMSTFAERREVYDNAYLTFEYEGGAQGRVWASYVAAGNDHGLGFRIFGESGSLQWRQESPEDLWVKPIGGPAVRFSRGYDELSAESRAAARFRPGHPEGYALAFANLYTEFAKALMARALQLPDWRSEAKEVPTVEDGAVVMATIDAATRSNRDGGVEVKVSS